MVGNQFHSTENSIQKMRLRGFVSALILEAVFAVSTALLQAVGTVVGCVCGPPGGGSLIESTCTVCNEAPGCLHNDKGSEFYSCELNCRTDLHETGISQRKCS